MEQARILIVDDDPDITEVMRVVLENKGYTVDSAADGNEAMAQINSARPDLIILDVMMNTLREGFLLSRELKKDPAYKQIPILMVTAVKEKFGINFKPAAGDEDWLPVEDYLDKPVEPNVLLEKVAALLQKP
ncbi:MAG TPA: response regulator [Sedimentisphaerales bacterium]|nr:response regulator [Sedimentisphaerales bacterium]